MDFQLHHFPVETGMLLAGAFFLGMLIGLPARKILRRSFAGGEPVMAGAGGAAVSDDGLVEDVAQAADATPAATTQPAATEGTRIVTAQSDAPAPKSAPPAEAASAAASSDDSAVAAVDLAVAAVENELAKANASSDEAPSDKASTADQPSPAAAAPAADSKTAAEADKTDGADGEAEGKTMSAAVEGDDGEVIHSAPGDIAPKPRKRRFFGWLFD